MVNIGSDDEVVLIAHDFQQFLVRVLRGGRVAVDHDVARPECPLFLECFVGIKPAGVHVVKVIFGFEVTEVLMEALACVREASSGRKASSSSH